jgi:hypothetical protein
LSLDPEHREFEAKKEFGAECRDRRNQRRNKALLRICEELFWTWEIDQRTEW